MKLVDTILVATDLGPVCDNILNTAVSLAKTYDSKILLLHVIPERVYQWVVDGPGIPELEKRIHDSRRYIRARDVPDVEVMIGRGSPASTICETAISRNADLIVLSSRSSSGVGSLGLGTTADRVIQKATIPVWLVRPGDTDIPPRNILCPVDGSDASRRALKNAHHLARRFRAKLTVLHVLEPTYSVYSTVVLPNAAGDSWCIAPQTKSFDEFLKDWDFHDSSWILKTRNGKPHEQIMAEIAESGIDLLVIGTVGKTGVTRFFIGSVTQKISRKMPCPILTMKARDLITLRLDVDLQSLEEHLSRGQELLDNGFPTEAVREFDHCLVLNPTLASAWEGKSLAYEHLGDTFEAKQAKRNARRIRERLN